MVTKELLCKQVAEWKSDMVDMCSHMVQINSETPPSNTHAIAEYVTGILKQIPGIEIQHYMEEEPVENVVAVIKSGKPGKRLVFNGHLDTYPVGDLNTWDDSPWSGKISDGYIYGRGSADMKGGIACFITAARVLAEHKDSWNGEIVLTLAGDEEAMSMRGTGFLLQNVPEATGDAMICADVGAPDSLRFGQKGLLWISLESHGKPAHGAHLHKGESAIDKLVSAMTRIKEALSQLPVEAPEFVTNAIMAGSQISELGAGPGETEILQKITVNFGTITGGTSPNLVPEYAKAEADIRIPAGVKIAQIEAAIKQVLAEYKGIDYHVMRAYEANWSDINHPIFGIVRDNSQEILGKPVVVTFRVGASDARLYRLLKQVPSINCGLTAYNLGGPNEHVSIDEMVKIAQIHALSALDFLQ